MKIARAIIALLLVALALTASRPATAGEPRPFIKGSWQEIRRAHAGQPAIVHLWGLTCAPCRVEMPEWGKLVRANGDINLITIHAERLPPDPSAVRGMLEAAGLLAAENWMFDDGILERLRYEIDPKWRGELPVTLLIGRDGTTSVTSGPADLDAVANWVRAQSRPLQ